MDNKTAYRLGNGSKVSENVGEKAGVRWPGVDANDEKMSKNSLIRRRCVREEKTTSWNFETKFTAHVEKK